jgi:putative flippase GtrA
MTAILTNSRERTRFLKFVVVGTIGAVVDFGVANLFVYAFGASLVVGGTISFISAILSNFFWNRYWTYPDSRTKPVGRQLVQFALVSVMGLTIRIPILRWLEPILFRLFSGAPFRLPVLSPDVLAKNLTLAVAVLIVMFWNFFVNRYWTYNDVD